jgi:hypothetical protein
MMKRMKPLSTSYISALVLAAAASCATTPPPPAAPVAVAVPAPAPVPKPPAEPVFSQTAGASEALVGSVVAASPHAIAAELDTLSRRLALPMMLGRELLTSIGGIGLGGKDARLKDILDRLEPSARLAVVWVLPPRSQAKGFCAALTFKDADVARKTFAEMGTPGAERDGMSERRTATGDVLWGGVKGRTLFVSGSPESLLLAGGLAEVAQATPFAGQLSATVLPPALMKASGKTREAILTELSTSMANGLKGTKAKETPAFQRMATGMMEEVAKLALDSSSARFVLDVNAQSGLLLRSELVPIQGTDFAVRAGTTKPYQFDLQLPVRDDRTGVFAFGNIASWLSLTAKMFEASGPAGRAMWRQTSKLIEAANDWSCVFDAAELGFATLCSAPLVAGHTGAVALDAAVAMVKAQNAWEAELEGRKPSAMKIKRSGGVVEIEKKVEGFDPSARAMAVAIAGGETLRTAFTVRDGKLLEAVGRDARKTLTRHGAGGLSSAPLVAAALTSTKGDEAMASVDVISFLLHVLGKAKDAPGGQAVALAGALPGVADMKAPFVFALRGGQSMSFDFRIPLASLEAMAAVVRGMMGGAGQPPQ